MDATAIETLIDYSSSDSLKKWLNTIKEEGEKKETAKESVPQASSMSDEEVFKLMRMTGPEPDVLVDPPSYEKVASSRLNSIQQTAAWAHENGWMPVPITKGKKFPCVKDWSNVLPAECKLDFDSYLKKRFANSGIGLMTGEISGITVVDIDTKDEEGVVNGLEYWNELMKTHGMPTTMTVRTGSGGLHYFFKYFGSEYASTDKVISTVDGIPVAIDLKNDGGQVVFAGTIHPTTKKPYEIIGGVENEEAIIAECPDWLRTMIKKRTNNDTPKNKKKKATAETLVDSEDDDSQEEYEKELIQFVRQYFEIDLCKSFDDHFYFRENIDTLYSFNSMEPIKCPLCNRVHERDNWMFITVWENQVHLHCRRSESSIFIGNFNDPMNYRVETAIQNGEEGLTNLLMSVLKNDFFSGDKKGEYGFMWSHKLKLWEQLQKLQMLDLVPKRLIPLIEVHRRNKVELLVRESVKPEPNNDDVASLKKAVKACDRAIASCNDYNPEQRVIKKLMGKTIDIERATALNETTMCLPIQKGKLIDFSTGTVRARTKADSFSYQCPISYDPEVSQDFIIKFMKDIQCNDEENYLFMQRLLGYILLGENKERKLIIFWGVGRNAKSTLINLLEKAFFNIFCSADKSVLITTKNKTAASPELAELKGKRIVVISETEDGETLNEAVMKSMTGGDTLTGRFNHCDNIKFKAQFSPIMVTNNKPNTSTDPAVWSRILLVPFLAHFSEEEADPDMLDKLTTEKNKSAFLNWLLEGVKEYHRIGLAPPTKIEAANAEYKSEANSFASFIKERCSVDPEASTQFNTIKEAYETFCEVNGMLPIGMRQLSKELSRKFTKKRKAAGIFYQGLLLNEISIDIEAEFSTPSTFPVDDTLNQ